MNKDFKNIKLLVIGDVMIDRYIYGDVSRISPEFPVPVVKYKSEESRLGGAANTANNIRAIGCDVEIMGAIGDDLNGKAFQLLCKKSNVSTSLLHTSKQYVTIVKTRYLNQNNAQIVRVDEEEKFNMTEQIENEIIARLRKTINNYAGIIISDYMKGYLTKSFTQKIISLANECGVKTFIDVKDPDYEKYKNCYLLKPNLNELKLLTKMEVDSMDKILNASIYLKKVSNVRQLLVTLGANGMLLIDENNNITQIPTVAREVFDVTGAGDTVLAYVGAMHSAGVDIENSVRIANDAAGVKVSMAGAVPVSLEMLKAFKGLSSEKIITKENWISQASKMNGKRVVFTNGCFDIIHAGHIDSLRFAKKQGDVLVVGLNSDASIKRLKGESRPVNTFADRAEVLSALECVDYVIGFEEDTPYDLIKAVMPDVLVKSGDYTIETIVGRDIVEGKGGKVVIAPLKKGLSTTNIINKLN